MSKLSQTKIDVLDSFEKRSDGWTWADFTQALIKAMKASNRHANTSDARTTIIEADHLGKWPKTVRRYVMTHTESSLDDLPGELNALSQRFTPKSPNKNNPSGTPKP